MKKCTICGKPIILVPSAIERARKFGGTPQYYTNLFITHPECFIAKYNNDTSELIKRLNKGPEA